MNPKIVISGYPRLINLAKSVLGEMEIPSGIGVEFIASRMLLTHIDSNIIGPSDLLICGQQTYDAIKTRKDFKIIPIKINGFDLLNSILEARNYSATVAVLNYINNIPEIDKYQSLLNVCLKQRVYTHQEEARDKLLELKKKGYTAVIGSSLICNLAEECDIKGIFIYSRSTIKDTLNYAIYLMSSYKQETERVETIKAIVSFAYSGIIGTDRSNRITTYNPAAEKILGIKPEVILGRKLSEVLPEFEIIRTNGIMHSLINEICTISNKKVIYSSVPVNVNGEKLGQVTVFHDTAMIQKAEQKIRLASHTKKFNAQYSFGDIVGKSATIKRVLEKAKIFSITNSSVLITGETGTGKELFAQSIHNNSLRRDEPFVSINCGALPESLLDSELFGYERGAFTGANKEGKPGLFEMAHKGTIFLDEVGDILPPVQVRLLRVLQEKEVMRIGGDYLIPVDVRVISATNRNLWDMVGSGKFREDLYYRLGVLELRIPPLRERTEDLPDLIKSILDQKAPQLKPFISAIIKASKVLSQYDWPGNIRELENILERFIALYDGNDPRVNTFEQLFIDCLSDRLEKKNISPPNVLKERIDETEKKQIYYALKNARGNKVLAAKSLGISRSTLYNKLKKYELCNKKNESR